MGVSRTRTVKNKHAANKSGIKGSKASRNPAGDPVVRARKPKEGKPAGGGAAAAAHAAKGGGKSSLAALLKKRQKKKYTAEQLGIPKLNMITPVGVTKPKGKKKGKVFVDDPESMATILAMAQAAKDGQIESKMMKARQLEEIREARRVEAEKKDEARKAKLDETKDSMRKKRRRGGAKGDGDGDRVDKSDVKEAAREGTKAMRPKKKKSVSFA